MSATASAVRAQNKKTVNRYAKWLHADPLQAFADGEGVCLMLDINGQIDVYEVTCRADGDRIVSWQMQKQEPDGEVAAYTLPGDLSRCCCPHSQWRPNGQPCRHRSALRAALAKIGFTF